MANTARYQHRPLRYDDSIRVLQILPSAVADAPVRVYLSSYRLSDPKLQFEALSYTWGDPSDKTPISVGGLSSSLLVPQSSVNAVKALRYQDTRRTMWIDSICINQDDVRERSTQVQMMARIFSRASCTIIYLGEHTPSSRLVFEELSEAMAVPTRLEHGHPTKKINRPLPSSAVIKGLNELIHRPWFRRVWVLQEVYMSQSMSVLCGHDLGGWDILLQLFFGYSQKLITETYLPMVCYLSHHKYRHGKRNTWGNLWECLMKSRELLASDARDKVFSMKALLGVNQDELDLLIDYNKSIEWVFTEVAGILMRYFGLWFSRRLKAMEICDRTTSVSSTELRLRGWRYGSIAATGKTFSFCDYYDAKSQLSLITALLECDDIVAAINDPNFEGLAQYFPPVILREMTRHTESDLAMFFGRGRGLAFGALECLATHSEPTKGAMEALQSCRIFLCMTGDIGIVNDAACEGDVIVIVDGTVSPCLLRPRPDGNWTLISGDCYIGIFDRTHPIRRAFDIDSENWGDFNKLFEGAEDFIVC
ncbi:putative Heterokaryon incompatibility domain-containing protein [Seiridium unicorne]|uniref:Heterokaryon incompatibility domain-containing protein n=1 Tax=Seiridium unicorne TaxID=138068 RepID=A0ABR2UNI8_9PEZI